MKYNIALKVGTLGLLVALTVFVPFQTIGQRLVLASSYVDVNYDWSGYNIGFYPAGNSFSWGADFTVAGNGDFNLAKVTMPLVVSTYDGGNPNPADYQISVVSDVGGKPDGDVVGSLTPGSVGSVSTNYAYDITGIVHGGMTYWLLFSPIAPDSGYFTWNFAYSPIYRGMGHTAGRWSLTGVPTGDWTVYVGDVQPAFLIEGTPVVVPATSPPQIICPEPLILECTNGSATGIVQAGVLDTNGLPLEVVWTVDGISYQTNDIPSGGTITASNLTFTANFGDGGHVVVISASNFHSTPATCSTTVTVRDTTAPQIVSIEATPNMLWPPNKNMIPVNVDVAAVDNCDPSSALKITQVTSNEPENLSAPDWEITGRLSVNLRADRFGMGRGRIYTIQVRCEDSSGNISYASVNVTVPHDKK